VTEAIELDPFGGETNRSTNPTWHKQRYATWERDWTGDESQFRRYHGWWSRFAHPDPWDGSYDLNDPQSLNRYAYVQNDPVNFIDPSGLDPLDAVPGFNPGFIPAWLNGWNRTTNPTEDFINYSQLRTTWWHDFWGDRREYPWFFGGWLRFSFGQQSQHSSREDPCDSKYAPEVQRDLSQIATTIGGKLDAKWKIQVPTGLSVATAVGRLEASEFAQFHSYNPQHPGVNLQGQLNGRWSRNRESYYKSKRSR